MLYEIAISLFLAAGFYQTPAGLACSHWRATLYQGANALQMSQYGPMSFVNVPAGTYAADMRCVDLAGNTSSDVVTFSIAVPATGTPHQATKGSAFVKHVVTPQEPGEYWPTPK